MVSPTGDLMVESSAESLGTLTGEHLENSKVVLKVVRKVAKSAVLKGMIVVAC